MIVTREDDGAILAPSDGTARLFLVLQRVMGEGSADGTKSALTALPPKAVVGDSSGFVVADRQQQSQNEEHNKVVVRSICRRRGYSRGGAAFTKDKCE